MSHTILVVGTDRRFVDHLSDHLTDEGFRVRHAYTARLAIEALERLPTDAVVADGLLPEWEADLLARHLRLRGVAPQVVAIGSACLAARCDAVVVRLSECDHLGGVLRRILPSRTRASLPSPARRQAEARPAAGVPRK